ncbi:MAG: helix-turn-helix transcriptional regulator [Nitrospirota bacterium]
MKGGEQMKSLGEYLKEARMKMGMSLREVEDRAGVSNAYISLIESGKRTDPHPNILKSLAAVYGLNITELMGVAGYLDAESSANKEMAQVEKLFQQAISDPTFKFGRRSKANIDFQTKKFIANMYKELKKKKEGGD